MQKDHAWGHWDLDGMSHIEYGGKDSKLTLLFLSRVGLGGLAFAAGLGFLRHVGCGLS
jgi:hypothetical protein